MLKPPAKLWVEALRSGKYKQGTGVLHNEDTDAYCPLGVACEVYTQYGGTLLKETDEDIDDNYAQIACTAYEDEIYFLPERVRDWLGLSSSEGHYNKGHGWNKPPYVSLVSHNDENKYTFAQIADLIEAEPDGLFE